MSYIYQIVYPFQQDIYGSSFKEAVKNYVKTSHDINIRNMIIKDQVDHYETILRYYKENDKNKVGIDVYPYTGINGPYAVYGEKKLRMPLGSSIVAPIDSINTVLPTVVNPVYGSSVVTPVTGPIVTGNSSGIYATENATFVPNLFSTLAKLFK